MKYYIVETEKLNNKGEAIDTWGHYQGFNFSEAKKAKATEERIIELYSPNKGYVVVGKIYELPDDIDPTDPDAIIEAICEEGCYNEF